MSPSTRIQISKIEDTYPKAMTNQDLIAKVADILKPYGYGETTLLASALCCDEVNRELEKDFHSTYGDHFSMGGLAGFAFGGLTSFGAMAHHIPAGGSCLVLYGPHVGIDSDGNVGKINRRGRIHAGACCGSAAAAASYVSQVRRGCPKAPMPNQRHRPLRFFDWPRLFARRLARRERVFFSPCFFPAMMLHPSTGRPGSRAASQVYRKSWPRGS